MSTSQCISDTKKGVKCKKKAEPGSDFCKLHKYSKNIAKDLSEFPIEEDHVYNETFLTGVDDVDSIIAGYLGPHDLKSLTKVSGRAKYIAEDPFVWKQKLNKISPGLGKYATLKEGEKYYDLYQRFLSLDVSKKQANESAEEGQIDEVIYIYENSGILPDKFVLNDNNYEVYKYIFMNDDNQEISLNEIFKRSDIPFLEELLENELIEVDNDMITEAILLNKSDIVDWLVNNGIEYDINEEIEKFNEVYPPYTEEQTLNAVKFFFENNEYLSNRKQLDIYAGAGYLNVIEYVYEHGGDLPTYKGSNTAALKGNLETVKYIAENTGKFPSGYALSFASKEGYNELVDWVAENSDKDIKYTDVRYDFTKKQIKDKTKEENYLKLSDKFGYSITEENIDYTTKKYAENNDLESLKFIYETVNKFPLRGIQIAFEKNNEKMLKWFLNITRPHLKTKIGLSWNAIKNSDLNMFKILYEKYGEDSIVNWDMILRRSLSGGRKDIFNWLLFESGYRLKYSDDLNINYLTLEEIEKIIKYHNIMIDKNWIRFAIIHNRLDFLELFLKFGGKLPSKIVHINEQNDEMSIWYSYPNIKTMDYLFKNGVTFDGKFLDWFCEISNRNIKWAYENLGHTPKRFVYHNDKVPVSFYDWLVKVTSKNPTLENVEKAIRNNDLEFVKWYNDMYRLNIDKNILGVAVVHGKEKLVQFILENTDIVPTINDLNEAASRGNFDSIKVVYEFYDILPSEDGIEFAIENKHYELVRWILSKKKKDKVKGKIV